MTKLEALFFIAILFFIVAPVIVLFNTSSTDTICRGGYIHSRDSGRQILNENGGGIPCTKEQK